MIDGRTLAKAHIAVLQTQIHRSVMEVEDDRWRLSENDDVSPRGPSVPME